jgi:hypothetical protein
VDDHRGDCITKLKKRKKRDYGVAFTIFKNGLFLLRKKISKKKKIIELITALQIAKFQIKNKIAKF